MKKSNLRILFRSLLASYLFTLFLLLLLALGLYRFHLNEAQISLGINGVYLLSCFLAGMIAGKMGKSRKFLRGLLSGAAYVLILFVLSALLRQSFHWNQDILTAFLLCCGSGMIGGMIS